MLDGISLYFILLMLRLDYLGRLIWVVGVGFESLADVQKSQFRALPANQDKWIQEGLWKYSRHPNYFGEITTWWGFYFLCFNGLSGIQSLFALVSPITVTCLLMFASGIPILERNADKKWGGNVAYQRYKVAPFSSI